MTPGNLFVVSAPSGAGKSSLVQALLEDDPNIRLSVSYTTRAPRTGEADGVHYHFVSPARFRELQSGGEFLESAEVYGNLYGTSKIWIQGQIEAGQDLLLEIDWQGAAQVRRLFPQAVGIFILPPSLVELERRLRQRAQDSDEVVAQRLAAAREDISHALEFDYLLVNDVFDATLADLRAVVRARHLSLQQQMDRLAPLLGSLLG